MQTQFRYLTNSMRGKINADHLASDNMANDSRTLLALRHRSYLGRGWRNLIDIRDVSDSQYFEDLAAA